MYRIRHARVTDAYIVEYYSNKHQCFVYLHGGFRTFAHASSWLQTQLLDKTPKVYEDFD